MTRQLSHRKDAFDKRDHILMPGNAPLAGFTNMIASLGPVRDQGQAGSCTGNASGGFLDFLYNTQGRFFKGKVPQGDMFSALYIYAEERIADGTFPQDEGSDSRSAMRVLNQLGACLNSQMPYNDQEMSLVPDEAQSADAQNFKIGAYHRVLIDEDIWSFRSCLASGYCHIIGIPVYAGIQSDECAETGNLPLPKRTDTPIGGHELLVFGNSDKQAIELVRNSWGPTWGNKGNLQIPYAYYDIVGGNDACDSWVGHMGKPWQSKSK